jgi:hypothetical protein
MAAGKREKMMENLAMASVLGFLAFVVGAASLAAESNSESADRAVLARAGASIGLASRSDDPSFDRVFRIQDDSTVSFGAVLTFRSPKGSALVGARFSKKGELLGLSFIGSCSSRLPPRPQDIVGEFPGADESLARAANAVRGLSSADAGADS